MCVGCTIGKFWIPLLKRLEDGTDVDALYDQAQTDLARALIAIEGKSAKEVVKQMFMDHHTMRDGDTIETSGMTQRFTKTHCEEIWNQGFEGK